jgi:hypothetical protein
MPAGRVGHTRVAAGVANSRRPATHIRASAATPGLRPLPVALLPLPLLHLPLPLPLALPLAAVAAAGARLRPAPRAARRPRLARGLRARPLLLDTPGLRLARLRLVRVIVLRVAAGGGALEKLNITRRTKSKHVPTGLQGPPVCTPTNL